MSQNHACIYTANILIVDDTLENLRLLSTMLAEQGYDVRKAIDGKMALTAVQTVLPDLILLDIMMPGLDGYEVCRCLKADPKTASIPIIFLSALHESFDKVKAFALGGIDYITKPFYLEEVLARVQNQLELKAAKQEILYLNTELENRLVERTQQLEAAHAQLLMIALHDPLTGLPNRSLFLDRLEIALNRTKVEPAYQFAVLLLDCDRFKAVNNSLGHRVGDALLVTLAQRLEALLNPDDTLARLSRDEFVILQSEIKGHHSVTQLAERILEALARPVNLQGYDVFINASVGIAVGDREYDQPEHLLRDADTAMSRAKATGKARYRIFDSSIHNTTLQVLQLEADLRRAIAQQEFRVYYQPIVSLKTGKIVGFEALVRWQHPKRGLVSPAEFIPVAEETGLIIPIGSWVLREACSQLYRWQQQELTDTPLIISVNVSARQFSQPDLIEQIDEILAETQLDPRCLKLEITESALMENTELASEILQQLRNRKIQLSLDDFGTGYSSLSYLHSFPVDMLKIDKSFVQHLNGTTDDLGLIPTIMTIAGAMGISVIAEGIETCQQLTQLRSLQCHFSQGYLFSKPLAATDAVRLIASNPQW